MDAEDVSGHDAVRVQAVRHCQKLQSGFLRDRFYTVNSERTIQGAGGCLGRRPGGSEAWESLFSEHHTVVA